jgi:hypothetical protein
MLEHVRQPLLFTEGEYKSIGVWRCAIFQAETPDMFLCPSRGVYSWRGIIGKTDGPRGERRDVNS